MRFNRKALEAFILFCLLVATTTLKSGSGSWAHTVEASAAVLILLSLLWSMRDGRRTRGSKLTTTGRSPVCTRGIIAARRSEPLSTWY